MITKCFFCGGNISEGRCIHCGRTANTRYEIEVIKLHDPKRGAEYQNKWDEMNKAKSPVARGKCGRCGYKNELVRLVNGVWLCAHCEEWAADDETRKRAERLFQKGEDQS